MRKINLTQGKSTLVSDEDYEWLMQWKWYFNGRYAIRKATKKDVGFKYGYQIAMHQIIIGTPKGFDTDHINGNKLDNQRHNLRRCTRSQNLQNKKKPKHGKSKYKGVHWDKEKQKWRAQITINRQKICIGSYKQEIDAALAYNKKAMELFGKFARPNEAVS